MVRFDNVSMSYGDSKVLNNISMHIEPGQLAVLIGPSGCGKTTTLQLINRLITPTTGKIFVNGNDISTVDPVKLRRSIGYVIQEIGLFPHMTIKQNIEIVPKLLGWDEEKRTARTKELLKLVDIDEKYLDSYPAKMSGGQQQRIGLLRALAVEPPIILMDEPFGALDPITRESLQDEIMSLQKKLHKTIIFVTHDMDEALKIADVIILMKDGDIVQMATPRELLSHPANEFVETFIGKHRSYSGKLDKVKDVMNARVVCSRPDTSVVEAVDLMRRERVSSVFIVDDDRHLLGQISVEDIEDAACKGSEQIIDIARRDITTVTPEDSAQDVFVKMRQEHVDERPVINEQGQVIGIVTRRSIVTSLASIVWQGDSHD